jgi:hypothetical protein
MAGPYTAFTYGDPSVSPAVIGVATASFVGYTTSGNAYPVPFAQELKNGTVGIAYSETVSASGGVSPYTFSIVSGTLPSGLSLNGSTGVISGTPTIAGISTFAVRATGSLGLTGDQTFSITIASAAVVSVSNYGWCG